MNPNVLKYVEMQKRYYNDDITDRDLEHFKYIVGPSDSFDQSVGDKLYEHMFFDTITYNKVALDFGCGVGRMIQWFSTQFKRIDGVDISLAMIRHAHEYLSKYSINNYALYFNNGYDLSIFLDNYYDIVYSAWCLEHICVHELRNNYFKEFYRVLRTGGKIVIVMQGGDNYTPDSSAVNWYSNFYDAPGTNHSHDVKIDNIFDVTRDLLEIGYKNINYVIYPAENEKFAPPVFAGHQFYIIIKATK